MSDDYAVTEDGIVCPKKPRLPEDMAVMKDGLVLAAARVHMKLDKTFEWDRQEYYRITVHVDLSKDQAKAVLATIKMVTL